MALEDIEFRWVENLLEVPHGAVFPGKVHHTKELQIRKSFSRDFYGNPMWRPWETVRFIKGE